MTDSDQTSNPASGGPVVIKKYANRRLYDTRQSKYIVLQDIIDMINDGTEFVIEDAKSGEDITRSILNQIIFEQETQPQAFLFPLEFQKQLIRMYGDSYGHLLPDFLTQSLSMFAKERSQMAQAWQDMMAQNTEAFLKQSEALAKQNMDMFRNSWSMFMAGQSEPEEQSAPAPEEKTKKSDLEKMQAQLDALQAQIKGLNE